MIQLPGLAQAHVDDHLGLMQKKFKKGLAAALKKVKKDAAAAGQLALFSQPFLDYLSANLDDILTGSPDELVAIVQEVRQGFAPFADYAEKPDKGNAAADLVHKNTLAIVESCFPYTWFSEQKAGWGAYALVAAHNLRICPYCHLHHVNYHVEPASAANPEFRMRPPLDHFLPKSKYPYLAVSLSNLIPSCTQCNSSVKTAADPLLTKLPHPLGSSAVDVRFSVQGMLTKKQQHVAIDDIKLSLIATGKQSQAHVKAFFLRQRYGWYRQEIKDMFDRDRLHQQVSKQFQGYIPRDLFVRGFAEAEAEQRALGLCLRDICKEIIAGVGVGALTGP